ncbi:butyrophilin-like protein 2 [Dendropsophus ebraccatus]|uniref:butyrophilin-like protein 2 n=1 Tax=Dendropsophus ebraccatus TaxID=150705 RepID=UPI0038312C6A
MNRHMQGKHELLWNSRSEKKGYTGPELPTSVTSTASASTSKAKPPSSADVPMQHYQAPSPNKDPVGRSPPPPTQLTPSPTTSMTCTPYSCQSGSQPSVYQVWEHEKCFHPNHPKAKKLNVSIARLLALETLPFCLVDTVGFRHVLALACPQYQMPSRIVPIVLSVLVIDLIIFCAVSINVALADASGQVGDSVTLQCTFTLKLSQSISVVWEKVGDTGDVYRYENGEVSLNQQNPNFRGRTSLFPSQLPAGNASLRISEVQANDAGVYRCTITNSLRKVEGELRLNVRAYSTVISEDLGTTLRCLSPSWYPRPTVQWLDGTSGRDLTYLSSTRYIVNLSKFQVISDFTGAKKNMTYICIIKNIMAEQSAVYPASTITVLTSNVTGKKGSNVILNCTFTPDVTQSSNVLWEKVGDTGVVYRYEDGKISLTNQNPNFSGRTLLFTGQLSAGNASLRISPVYMMDAGDYKCTVSNSRGRGESKLSLDVKDLTLTIITADAVGLTGDSVTLRCNFPPDMSHSSNVLWEKVGNTGVVYRYENGKIVLTDQNPNFSGRTSLFTDQLSAGSASLMIRNMQTTDVGVYRCTITNSNGQGSNTLSLDLGAYSTVTITKTSSTSLRCSSNSWYPKPTVQWLDSTGRDLTYLSSTNYVTSGRTFKVISDIRVTVRTYMCVMKNAFAKQIAVYSG